MQDAAVWGDQGKGSESAAQATRLGKSGERQMEEGGRGKEETHRDLRKKTQEGGSRCSYCGAHGDDVSKMDLSVR